MEEAVNALNRTKMVYSPYDGEGNFRLWLKKIKQLMRSNNIPVERQAQLLAGNLEKNAFTEFCTLPQQTQETNDLQIMETGLINLFCTPERVQKSEELFSEAKQQGRTVRQFSMELRELLLSMQGNHNWTQPEIDEKLRKQFLRGLDPGIRDIIAVCDPATFEDAIRLAERKENHKDTSHKAVVDAVMEALDKKMASGSRTTVAYVDETSQMQQLVKKYDTIIDSYKAALDQAKQAPQTRQQHLQPPVQAHVQYQDQRRSFQPGRGRGRGGRGRSFGTPGSCYNCGKMGHRQANCWLNGSNTQYGQQARPMTMQRPGAPFGFQSAGSLNPRPQYPPHPDYVGAVFPQQQPVFAPQWSAPPAQQVGYQQPTPAITASPHYYVTSPSHVTTPAATPNVNAVVDDQQAQQVGGWSIIGSVDGPAKPYRWSADLTKKTTHSKAMERTAQMKDYICTKFKLSRMKTTQDHCSKHQEFNEGCVQCRMRKKSFTRTAIQQWVKSHEEVMRERDPQKVTESQLCEVLTKQAKKNRDWCVLFGQKRLAHIISEQLKKMCEGEHEVVGEDTESPEKEMPEENIMEADVEEERPSLVERIKQIFGIDPDQPQQEVEQNATVVPQKVTRQVIINEQSSPVKRAILPSPPEGIPPPPPREDKPPTQQDLSRKSDPTEGRVRWKHVASGALQFASSVLELHQTALGSMTKKGRRRRPRGKGKRRAAAGAASGASNDTTSSRPGTKSTVSRRTVVFGAGTSLIGMLALMFFLIQPTSANEGMNPLMCSKRTQMQYYRIPESIQCNSIRLDKSEHLYDAEIELYKRNIAQYMSEAHVCRMTTHRVQTYSYFFSVPRLKKEVTEDRIVSDEECQMMMRHRKCTAGILHQDGDVYRTHNQVEYEYPGGGIHCCKWQTFEAVNCYLTTAHVYKRHGNNHMESNVADVSECDYERSTCSLADGSRLVWKVNASVRCEFIKHSAVSAKQFKDTLITDDRNMVLTNQDQKVVTNCKPGDRLNMSDQGVAFRVTSMKKQEPHLTRLRRQTAKDNVRNGTGIPSADFLAAELQAVWYQIDKSIHTAFVAQSSTACSNMQHSSRLLRMAAIANPTLAIRALTGDQRLTAVASGAIIAAWPCHELNDDEFEVLPSESRCSIPFEVKLSGMNKPQQLYLDPITNVLSPNRSPFDTCPTSGHVLQFRKGTFVYSHETGHLKPITDIQNLTIYQHMFLNFSNNDVIFRAHPVYTVEEIAPHTSFNDLWAGIERQSQVFGSFVENNKEKTVEAQRAASHLVEAGLFAVLTGATFSIKSLWIITCCTIVTVRVIVFVCFPEIVRKAVRSCANCMLSVLIFIAQLCADVCGIGTQNRVRARETAERAHEVVELPTILTPWQEQATHSTVTEQQTQRVKTPFDIRDIISVVGDLAKAAVIAVQAGSQMLRAFLDTGSKYTLMNEQTARTTEGLIGPHPGTLLAINGQALSVIGSKSVQIVIADIKVQGTAIIVRNLPCELLIGRDFLYSLGPITFDFSKNLVRIAGKTLKFTTAALAIQSGLAYGQCTMTTAIPARHEIEIPVTLTGTKPNMVYEIQNALRRPELKKADTPVCSSHSLLIVDGIVTTADRREDRFIWLRVQNISNKPVTVRKNQKIIRLTAREKQVSEQPSVDGEPVLLVDQEEELLYIDPASMPQPNDDQKPRLTSHEAEDTWLNKMEIEKSSLSAEGMKQLRSLLKEYEDCFSKHEYDLGTVRNCQFRINLMEGATPIRCRPYRTAHKLLPEVEKQVTEQHQNNLISESDSPWAAGIVMVPKKGNKWRMCVNYKPLNRVTIRDNFPIKRIDDIIWSLTGAKHWARLDCQRGYNQIEIAPEDRYKTSFITPFGQYQCNRLSFGMTQAPQAFQRLMSTMLRGLLGKTCEVFIDDTIVYSKTSEEDFIENVREILKRAREYNLKFNPEKCRFGLESMDFVGYTLTKEGYKPNSENISKLLAWEAPKNPKQLESFLGCPNFYREFVRNYAELTAPLYNLLKGEAPFVWTDECQRNFEEIKRQLASRPLLRYPDFKQPFHVSTDASGTSIGAEIWQIDPATDKRHPVSYMSRKLNPAERRYSTPEREMLAIYWAAHTAEPLIYGYRTRFYTDHKPLTGDEARVSNSKRIERWSLALQANYPDIEYVPGKDNALADALSRMDVAAVFGVDTEEMRTKQQSDPFASAIMESIGRGEDAFPDYKIIDGLLYYVLQPHESKPWKTEKPLLVIPETLQPQLLEASHDHHGSAHQGVLRTLTRLQQSFYFPRMHRVVTEYVKTCESCQQRKLPWRRIKAPLRPLEFGSPWSRVVIDLVGKLPMTCQGNQYMLTVIDHATKWPEAFPIPDKKQTTVARVLVREVILRYGTPQIIQSDMGSEFMGGLLKAICKLLQVKKLHSSAYHPQSQGVVERFHRTLKEGISAYVSAGKDDWDEFIPYVLAACRSSVNRSTGETPHFLLFMRDMRLPVESVLAHPQPMYLDSDDYKFEMLQKFSEAWKGVQESMKRQNEKMKADYDKDMNPAALLIGDLVRMRNVRKAGPFESNWGELQRVVGVSNDGRNATISPLTKYQPKIVHVNLLRTVETRRTPNEADDASVQSDQSDEL